MADIQSLRKQAKAAGMPVADVRTSTAAELRDYLASGSSASSKTKSRKSNPARGRKTRPAAKATTRGRKSAPAKRGPGRPKGSGKSTTRKSAPRAKASNGDAGRNFLEGINWGDHDAWNPRKGSPPDRIIRAVRKARGNRAKVVDQLMANVRDFVTLPKGAKPNSEIARQRLAYRVSRVMWEFALKTGQHEIATNRAAPGQGERYAGNGKGSRKRSAAAAKSTRKSTAKATGRKRGRPPGSKNRKRAGARR